MRLVIEWILLTAMSSRIAHPKTELNRETEAVHATYSGYVIRYLLPPFSVERQLQKLISSTEEVGG